MWSIVVQLLSWLTGQDAPSPPSSKSTKPTAEQLRQLPQLTSSDVDQLQRTWQLVAPDATTHGVEILIRLFDRYPETKAFFKRLNVSSPEEMRASARVKAHGGRVVTSLGGIIEQLGDGELVDETIFLLGDSHQRRGVTGVEFDKFSVVLLAYLKEALGDALSPEAEAAFGKLMLVFNTKMCQHL